MATMLPDVVIALTHRFDAWIVGSAARPGLTMPVNDYDVLVPYSRWAEASSLIPLSARPNSFRGWKFEVVECNGANLVDVWPGELGQLMLSGRAEWAWQPYYDIRLEKHF